MKGESRLLILDYGYGSRNGRPRPCRIPIDSRWLEPLCRWRSYNKTVLQVSGNIRCIFYQINNTGVLISPKSRSVICESGYGRVWGTWFNDPRSQMRLMEGLPTRYLPSFFLRLNIQSVPRDCQILIQNMCSNAGTANVKFWDIGKGLAVQNSYKRRGSNIQDSRVLTKLFRQ